MKIIDHIYVNGAFVKPHGTELFEIRNPATEQVIGRLTLGDQEDTRHAIAAAKEAFATFSQTGKEERIALLKRLHDTVLARADDLREATIEEYGAPLSRATWITKYAAQSFLDAAQTLDAYNFTRQVGSST